ncbi:pilus assembly protein [Nevskia soli]|uniref:pilus assembly protein n=1 Tax=Nevskia soli TaxID=418856 RepID=UPI00068950E8|nr:PilC/PilY family type IV pilus protein [Nevskia soli]
MAMLNRLNGFWLRYTVAAVIAAIAAAAVLFTNRMALAVTASPIGTALSSAAPISQSETTYNLLPVLNSVTSPPLVMLLLSRDEQLSFKAYTDYTDLNGDGTIETTYNDATNYSGYFDTALCYNYSSANNYFIAGANVAAGTHQCGTSGNPWSGNFLNWLTMTRLDMVRWVLYGGLRSTDTASATSGSTAATQKTVLKRAFIPNDIHSFAKVYTGTDANKYTPFSSSSGAITFCNTSSASSATAYSSTGYKPYLLEAAGSWPNWASTESSQCQNSDKTGGDSDDPTSANTTTYQVFVDVCDNTSSTLRESFCEKYTTGTDTFYKPAGLLQQYGESGQLRFGLLTGSYDQPRSGGVLRRNIGQIAGNGGQGTACTTGDEIDLRFGTFCNQTSKTEGIINTLNRFQITQWSGAPGTSSASYNDCNNYDIVNRDTPGANGFLNNPGVDVSSFSGGSAQNCSDWGNPLAEMYAEALRYIVNQTSSSTARTTGFQPSTSGMDNTLGLPYGLTWTPPYTTANTCASCSIVILSTGQTSFDTDELPSITNFPSEGISGATTRVGANEGISSTNSTYVIGYYGSTPTQTSTNSGSSTAPSNLVNIYQALCTAKTSVTDLDQVRGICPEVPTLEGGYQLAGLAFDAWTNDLIPTTGIAGTQRVQTFAVSLAESLPSLTIPVGGGNIVLSPLCQSNNSGSAAITDAGWRSCGSSNVQVGQLTGVATTTNTPGTFGLPNVSGSPIGPNNSSGSIAVTWDDSTWGNDHDLDMKAMISWCVGSACGNFLDSSSKYLICNGTDTTSVCGTGGKPTLTSSDMLVRVECIYCFAGNSLIAGFTVSGSNSSSTEGAQRLFLRPGSAGNANLLAVARPTGWSKPQIMKISGNGTNAVNTLQNPLFYAAKYGGFSYLRTATNPMPSSGVATDWSTGVSGPGLPDNYFPVHNPGLLLTQLKKVFDALSASTGSGTAAAVVANQRQGDGATYQALYIPTKTDTSNNTAYWLGELQAMFVDSAGNLREDTSTNTATLTESDFTTNPAVKLVFDTVSNTTKIQRYNCDPSGSGTCTLTAVDTLDNLNSLWNARDVLAAQNNGAETTQRTYSTAAGPGSGRYIFTYIDKNLDGLVGTGEQVDFVPGSFTGSSNVYYGILNVPDTASTTSLVNYIRGKDQAGLRSRTIIYASAKNRSNTQYTYPLGDIVNSTPTVVGTPAEAFDLLYNDATYGAFRSDFQRRRNVVYVGANDGMLHAFNAGFYNSSLKKFETTGIHSETTHALGSELWAYVPFNLLPHLTWLADATYTNNKHVFYFDGTPRAFDAHVFAGTADCTPSVTATSQNCHPYGWGTILVVGMRFGGGDLSLPACTSGTSAALQSQFTSFTGITCSKTGAATTIKTHSAYVVLDVTNPEAPPTVLGEVTGTTPLGANTMGYTTSGPTAISFSALNNSTTSVPTTDKWYFLVGSGPTPESSTPVLVNATSSQNAKLFVYNLAQSGTTASVTSSQVFDFGSAASSTNGGVGTAAASAFTGDPVSVDWNLDFIADAAYVGIAGGTAASPTGQLLKIDTLQSATPSNWLISSLTNPVAPVLQPPSVTTDLKGNKWVYDGTGRLYVSPDLGSSAQQYLFGVIDQGGTTASTFGNSTTTGLLDVTSGQVAVGTGTISGLASSITNESQLESAVQTAHGWKILLTTFPSTDTVDGAQRVLSSTSVLGGSLFASAFTPNTSLCLGTGLASLFAGNYLTGLANPTNPALGKNSTSTYYVNFMSLGVGLGAEPALHVNGNASGQVTVVTQTSTGSIVTTNASVATSISPGEVDWRQTHPNTGP